VAKIVNIDEMIPEDVEIVYRGKTYVIPGDVDGATVFTLLNAFRELAILGTAARGGEDVSRKLDTVAKRLNKLLLGLFQISDPTLTELPFGTKSLPIVVREILVSFGLVPADDAVDPPTPKASIPKTRKPSSARSRKPARSRSAS
jgi:hypothetical protein